MKLCDLGSQPILFNHAIILARYIHSEKEIKSLLFFYVKVKRTVDSKRQAYLILSILLGYKRSCFAFNVLEEGCGKE